MIRLITEMRPYIGGAEVRCPGDPDAMFRECPGMMLETLKIAAGTGLPIGRKTAWALHRHAGLIAGLPAEAKRDALIGIICGERPLKALLSFSDAMAAMVPELRGCIGFDQRSRYHSYDVYGHMARAAAICRDRSPMARTALLLHDIAKPLCFTEDADGTRHYKGHAEEGARMAEAALRRLKFPEAEAAWIELFIRRHDDKVEPSAKSIARWEKRMGRWALDKLLLIQEADILAHSEEGVREKIGPCRKAIAIFRQAGRRGEGAPGGSEQ